MKLLSIQYLRAVAALMVVGYHLGPQLARMGSSWHSPIWLSAGVDIFFVISGCIMWITTSSQETGTARFYWNRASRIVPLYYILTTATVGLLLVAPNLLQTSQYDAWHVMASYLFVPFAHPVTGAMEPLLFAGWTLNYEMFFYLIFGGTLVLPAAERMRSTLGILGAFVLAGLLVPKGPTALSFYTSSIILEFGIGMVLGWTFQNRAMVSRLPLPAVMAAGFLGLPLLSTLAPDAPRVIIFGVPATLIVIVGLAMDQRQRVLKERITQLLGDASYSIYLTHGMALSALGQIWRKLGLADIPGGSALFVAVAICGAAAAGVAVYFLVEKPLIGLARRARVKKSEAGAAPTPALRPVMDDLVRGQQKAV